MENSYLFDDMSCVLEETKCSVDRVCKNKRQLYDDEDDDDNDHHDGKFKSKNLFAERRRREKLKSRMLELRSVVPKITNMNKETIITDAISYIKELKISVTNLGNTLLQMEAEMPNPQPPYEAVQIIQPVENMKKWGIQSEVVVTSIDENKMWMKIVLEKKVGGITKLIEAIGLLGIQLVDTSVTTTKGAVLLTSSIEGAHGHMLVAEQVEQVLTDIIKVIQAK
uniref:transcription factor DYT1 n=1 Tax=Erigeron canadensis TaxID=72917 RepID=UPI001CB8AC4B|nr:transcription factor DYT1 [Erigeron canadensis]